MLRVWVSLTFVTRACRGVIATVAAVLIIVVSGIKLYPSYKPAPPVADAPTPQLLRLHESYERGVGGRGRNCIWEAP